ncbi:MAG: BlaI/MecI/CopY family transcriptional regulator [Bacteroidales bacterium]|nr:BlaI/MecI/CopY family transcriptional regulator [Bacteroidales bacterium]
MANETTTTQLTKAELTIMNYLWDKGEATVHQLHDMYEEPKPAYTTTLTVMQVLTKKGIVTFERSGKAHIYKPLMSREEYQGNFMEHARKNVFGGSMRSFFSFFAKSENISKEELKEILKEIEEGEES